MFIVDSHCDSIQKVDDRKFGIVNPHNFSTEHRQLQLVALFCGWPGEDSVASFKRAARYFGHFSLSVTEEADRVAHVKSWADIEAAFASGRHGVMLSIEGGTGMMGSTDILRRYFNAGVRVFGLAWESNDLAESNRLPEGIDRGLSQIGHEFIAEGNRLGLIFDVSHLSDRSFWQVLEEAAVPPVASHSNMRALASHSRNLTDEMALALAARGGMIGLNLAPAFVDDLPERRTVDRLFDHLDHAMSLGIGDHMGFGCDIDGTSGKYPVPLDESRSIHDRLIEAMLRRNYSEETVRGVAGENWLGYFKKNLPK